MKNKNFLFLIAIILAVILIIILIFLFKKPEINADLETIKCIGNNSILYYSKVCSHCEEQKRVFGDNFNYLTSIDCLEFPQECWKNNIIKVPSWVIKGVRYEGKKSMEELISLTEC